MLPRLLVWTSLGILAYGSLEASASAYHYLRDARVKPLVAAQIRAEVHALVKEVARRQPAQANVALQSDALGTSASLHAATTEATQAPALAFVPYTHVPQIKANATLYECRLFSMFACEPVGRVVELLPGEVELAPATPETTLISTGPERGQYAVMQLTDPHAAEAESLRVRAPLDSLRIESSQSPALEPAARAETLL